MVVWEFLMCSLLNCSQISQAPGASIVEYPRENGGTMCANKLLLSSVNSTNDHPPFWFYGKSIHGWIQRACVSNGESYLQRR